MASTTDIFGNEACPGEYVVIARRYRPQTFSQVVAQRSVVTQLQNEIRDARIGHGYLFTGPRGTGKTSMARIFAKALNCEKGVTTDPCGTCRHCQEVAAGTHLDVIEVDAATYSKVEDTRELMEGLNRLPFSARYKVYIIDEVHMFSNSSFNALLKNLEEPPERVVFMLCTTNPEKIPETVISRVRRLALERLSLRDITGSLAKILEQEKVSLVAGEEQAVLNAVALAADGGLRDAQVLLDQVISISGGTVGLENVRGLLGVVEGDAFTALLKALVMRDTQACLQQVAAMVDRGRDLQRFIKTFLSFLRDAVLIKAGASDDLVRVADPKSPDLREALDGTTLPFLLNVTQQFLDLEERIRGSAPPRFLLEFALIKLTAIDPRLVLDPELAGFSAGDRPPTPRPGGQPTGRLGEQRAPMARAPRAPLTQPRAASPMAAAGALLREAAHALDELAEPEVMDASAASIEAIHTTEEDRWKAFLDIVGERAPSVRGALMNARLLEAAETKLLIEFAPADRVFLNTMSNPPIIGHLREAALAVWKRKLAPKLMLRESKETQVEGRLDGEGNATITVREVETVELVATPAPAAARSTQPRPPRPEPVMRSDEMMSLEQAFRTYPEFRQACEMVERHFGVKPSSLNGRRLENA